MELLKGAPGTTRVGCCENPASRCRDRAMDDGQAVAQSVDAELKPIGCAVNEIERTVARSRDRRMLTIVVGVRHR